MKRRDFIKAAIGSATAWPFVARAQQPAKPLVGFLSTRSQQEAAPHTAAFLAGLAQAGLVDGQNITIDYRWASGQYELIPRHAAEMVNRQVAVIVAAGDPAAVAAKAATESIPVVFMIGDDPVRLRLVASMNRPGGNATGVSLISNALGAKRFELMSELLPNDTVALLVNPNSPIAGVHTHEVEAAAGTRGRKILVLRASTDADIRASFTALSRQGVHALIVQNDPFFDSRRNLFVELASQQKVAAIFHIREFPEADGLMSYGPSLANSYRDLGMQAGRVLQGTKPSELPVMQPTKLEFVINLKTAKALGLTVPRAMLIAADEVIEQ
jgi:putative ABC transport system substrate-binding protein